MSVPRLRVMHVIAGLEIGGAETMLTRLVEASLPELDQRVVSMTSGGALAPRFVAAGVPLDDLAMRRGRPSLGGLVRLVALTRRHRPQVIQSWMYHADLAATLALGLSGLRRQVRHAWNLRCSDMLGADYGMGFRAVRAAWTALAPRADLVIANSEAGLRFHVERGLKARTSVIPNGIDTKRFRPDPQARARMRQALSIPPERNVVAMVARVDPMKDHAGFLAALGELPETTALLIGRGTETLVAPASVLRLGERRDMPELLAAADLIVNASAYGEGFSNAVAEGMAAGLPAVATDVGDARLIVGDVGVICPPRDPRALAAAMARLLDELPAARRARAEAARQRIVAMFSLEACVARYIQTYQDLAAGR